MAASQANRVIEQLRKALLAGEAGLSDAQLLTSFVEQRDKTAFEALVRRHGPMVLGVCRRALRHHQDAEDAFQATFLVLARKAVAIKGRESVANWLYGVARNVARKARALGLRRQAREKQVVVMPEPEPVPRDQPWDDLLPLIDQELSRLPEKYRMPVVLCDLEGRPRKDVAGLLRIVEGTLSSRLTTGRKMLARRLARRGVVPSAGALAAALSGSAASGGVPGALVSSTVRSAIVFAAGRVAGGVISAQVAALAEGVLKAMWMTKVKLTTVVVLAIGLVLAGAAVSTRTLTAEPETGSHAGKTTTDRDGDGAEPVRADNPAGKQPGDQAADNAKVRALLKERLDVLRDMATLLKKQYEAGTATAEVVQQADLRVYGAELDLCETDKERVAIHEKIVGVLKEVEKRVTQLHELATVSATAVAEAKLKRLEGEIALERARAKAAGSSK